MDIKLSILSPPPVHVLACDWSVSEIVDDAGDTLIKPILSPFTIFSLSCIFLRLSGFSKINLFAEKVADKFEEGILFIFSTPPLCVVEGEIFLSGHNFRVPPGELLHAGKNFDIKALVEEARILIERMASVVVEELYGLYELYETFEIFCNLHICDCNVGDCGEGGDGEKGGGDQRLTGGA